VVVFGVFFFGNSSADDRILNGSKLLLPFSLSLSETQWPSLGSTFTSTVAWSTFQDYIKAAKNHDLETVKKLSYQLSATCANPEKSADCNLLMDGVYNLASSFRQEDFKNVAFDDRQIIMATDYLGSSENLDGAKTAILFVKSESGQPQLLSIKFCFGQDSMSNLCVNTNPVSRDSDQDGWWDDVESLFYK